MHQRLLPICICNECTDELQKRGVEKRRKYAILTDEISRTWSGMTARQCKQPQGSEENRTVAQRGGCIAGNARKKLEQDIGGPVVTHENTHALWAMITGVLENATEWTEEEL